MADQGPRYPWNAYIINQRAFEPDSYQSLLNHLNKYPPALIPCKIWFSSLTQKDINFLVAFAFINRDLIDLGYVLEALHEFNPIMTFETEWRMRALWDRLHLNNEEGRELREYYYGWDAQSGRVLNCNFGERGPEGSVYGPPVGTRRFFGNQGQALVDTCIGFEQQFLVDDGYDAAIAALPDFE